MTHIAHAVTLTVVAALLVFSNLALLATAEGSRWSEHHPNRPKLPLTVQFPTIHSLVEHEEYYRKRAAQVPHLMTYDLVEEADNPDLKPKRIRSKMCSLTGWCAHKQPSCDAACQQDSYLGVIRITNRKAAKKETEKKKIMIVSSPNGSESIGTDMWIRLFVKYFTFDWDGLDEEVGLKEFWKRLVPFHFDRHLKEMGGMGLYKEEPPEMTAMQKKDAMYKEDDDMIDLDDIEPEDIKGGLIDWSKEILDEFVIVIIPLVSKASRIKVEQGDYCKHNGTEFWGPYWDYDSRRANEPYMEKEHFFQTRLVSKIVRSEKPSITISLNADGKYGLVLGPGGKETGSKRPELMSFDMQKHVENVNFVSDIKLEQKAKGAYAKSGAMIDYFFDILNVPLAIEFDIFHPENLGLGSLSFKKKNSQGVQVQRHVLPEWFGDELREYRCMQYKHPVTPQQKCDMMMRWLIAFHELMRQRMRSKDWEQNVSELGRRALYLEPIVVLGYSLFIGVLFVVRSAIIKGTGKTAGKMYRGRRI